MKTLVLLAALLAGSLGAFLLLGMDAMAERDRAHTDLLQREKDLDTLLRQVGDTDDAAFAALLEEHERLTGIAHQRLESLIGRSPADKAPLRLDPLLRASTCEALRPGGAIHASLRAAAGLPSDEEQPAPSAPATSELALARIVAALAGAGGGLDVDTLELRGGGRAEPVPDVDALVHVEAQLVLSGALPDVLAALEALAPAEDGGLPAVSVRDASLRRIEPAHWGENLHRLATPPVRLTATVDVLLAAAGGS